MFCVFSSMLFLIVSTCAIDCLERLVWTLRTHSLTAVVRFHALWLLAREQYESSRWTGSTFEASSLEWLSQTRSRLSRTEHICRKLQHPRSVHLPFSWQHLSISAWSQPREMKIATMMVRSGHNMSVDGVQLLFFTFLFLVVYTQLFCDFCFTVVNTG